MKPLIELAKLTTDIDANGFDLLNIGLATPVPDPWVSTDDPRLTDDRVPLDGSVTNASVDNAAGIVQSKLNLNGEIPPPWLGTTSTKAAQGDLVEYFSNKGQPNGYAALDSGGKVPTAQIPSAVGTGTVTSVGLTLPAQFSVSGSPVTGAGTLAAAWANQADGSWFGNKEGSSTTPRFYSTALPTSLIPNLDASKVNAGTLAAARLPTMVGLGVGHAPGAVPDPGDGTGGALATDYLARDASWKPIPSLGASYEPTIPSPTLPHSNEVTGPQTVSFACSLAGVKFFYSLTSGSTGFIELPPISSYISLPAGAEVWSYAAKTGYINSAIVHYTNPNPP